MRRVLASLLAVFLLGVFTHATKANSNDPAESGLVMFWPNQEAAILKLTFSKFQNMGTTSGQMLLGSNVLVQNLFTKTIPTASFSVALLDKDRVRVGDGLLSINNLESGQSARVRFTCESLGAPSILTILASNKSGVPTSLKTISMTVISVPAGASLKVDDEDAGLTPAKINVGIGKHQLELTKEGFAIATTPIDVAPDEAPGGSITITLGGLSDDNIELRDGSILTGKVISMTLDSVVIDVEGQQQKLDRHRVKKIFLVEHTVTTTTIGAQEPSKKKAAAATPHH